MEEGAIRLSSSGIGQVRLDPATIRGEGGRHDPRLVIPIKIDLNEQPVERQIIIVRLTASLHHEQAAYPGNQFGAKISYDLIPNMQVRSLAKGPSGNGLELHFNLTQDHLKALESMRHQPGKNLYLHLEPVIVWNKHTGNASDPLGREIPSTLGEGGWPVHIGMFSEFAFFWLPVIETLRLELAAMNWAEKIFPGLGYDYYRLVEVSLPTTDVLVPKEAIEHFKEAKQDYDRGFHRECLMKCRFVLDEIEKHLKPQPDKHQLGSAITKVLTWPDTPTLTAQATYLNLAWVALYSLTNAAHHTPSTKSLLPADAHMGLISTAALLEYLGQLQ